MHVHVRTSPFWRCAVYTMCGTFLLFIVTSAVSGQEKSASGSPPRNADQSAEATISRAQLRYAGRSFDEWREQLLNDLDSATCKKAMAPLAAFGKNGYTDEAVAALSRRLRDDRDDVAHEAANALASIGAPAVAALVEGLGDERPHVRLRSAYGLGSLGSTRKPAIKPLLQRLGDKDESVRLAAIQALAKVAGDDEAIRPAFEQLSGSDEMGVRNALVSGLRDSSPPTGWRLALLLRLADDDAAQIRTAVGQILAQAAPPEKEVTDVLKRLLDDTEPSVWRATIDALGSRGNGATKIPVLADALTSQHEGAHLRRSGQVLRAIHVLGGAREQADVAVPALIEIVEGKVPDMGPQERLAAIDGLASLGPRAKRAVPVLEHWIFDEKAVNFGNGDLMQKHAERALRRIAAATSESTRPQ